MAENLYLDMDSTIFDYWESFNVHHTMNTGEDKWHVDWAHYHIHELYGISYADRYKYLTQEGFFKNMNPYDGSIETIHRLMDKYNILFVTNCVVKEAFQEKHDALVKHFGSKFDIEMLVALKHKHFLTKGLIIDDNPDVLEKCKTNGHDVIIFDQPWNKTISGKRVSSWHEIEKILL